ncbi:hypothetical protein AAFF_G00333670 [Aldrovandia affinis]|uniref:Uncharacterized protein n=1 Tax=Aldrovandia affinis TaxID=143900 RepID=A0AAD7R690_9TELE|nr:hypothetical protein AAFF_G00333670 [Aldrovandia affinis]
MLQNCEIPVWSTLAGRTPYSSSRLCSACPELPCCPGARRKSRGPTANPVACPWSWGRREEAEGREPIGQERLWITFQSTQWRLCTTQRAREGQERGERGREEDRSSNGHSRGFQAFNRQKGGFGFRFGKK